MKDSNVVAIRYAWSPNGLKSSERLLLLYLACHCGDDFCVVDKTTADISAATGLNRKTIPSSINDLASKKLISVRRDPGYPTIFTLLLPETGRDS